MKLKTVLKTTAISAVLLTLSFSNIKYSAILVKADDEKPAMNVEYHSKQDIINYYNQHPYDTDMETTYDVEPVVTPPYSAGVISSNVLENAQSMVNFVRYTAGLSSMTHIEQYYNEISQAASLCNYINNSLSHYPSQPELMSEDLYNLALEGASTSNIAMATYNLTIPDTIKMYLDDGDSGNISRVGHRRWILYPQLSGIGFGQVGGYSATNVINNSRNKDADEYGVAWPAQNTPIELLYNWSYQVSGYPWSITFGEKVSNDVNVTLTNLSTGQVWNFNNNSSDGEFYVNNAGYGQTEPYPDEPRDPGFRHPLCPLDLPERVQAGQEMDQEGHRILFRHSQDTPVSRILRLRMAPHPLGERMLPAPRLRTGKAVPGVFRYHQEYAALRQRIPLGVIRGDAFCIRNQIKQS